jgi:hypothetical protein
MLVISIYYELIRKHRKLIIDSGILNFNQLKTNSECLNLGLERTT